MQSERVTKPVLLVGNGNMAEAYANILNSLSIPFTVVGRSEDKIKMFAAAFQSRSAILLSDVTPRELLKYRFSIITTSMESLASITENLILKGAKNILVEKPASLSIESALKLANLAKDRNVTLRVALNRRFYSSVAALKNILNKEEPVCGFFDFTDNGQAIGEAAFHIDAKKHWAWSNPVHVFDTISFLLGTASEIKPQLFGRNELSWHPSASTFVGTILFGKTPASYATSWVCPGRWNIEVMTSQGRYKLSPMEKLQVMLPDQFQWTDVPLDNDLDLKFKPGVHQMVRRFNELVNGYEDKSFPDYFEYIKTMKMIALVAGY